jgi:predicted transport protein
MVVYDIDESGKLTKFNHRPVSKEHEIDDFIEANPELIEPDLKIIGREVMTSTGKRVDLMGIDKDANVVIIEDKKGKAPREVIAQILDYAVWAENRKGDELNQIAKRHDKLSGHKTLEKMFEDWTGDDNPDWNEDQKLYVVGEKIDDETKTMISYLNRKGIKLFTKAIKFHEGPGGKRKLTVDPIVVEKEKNRERKERTLKKTEQDHTDKGDKNCLEIYEMIKKHVFDLASDITMNVVNSSIGFRKNRNFLSIKFRQNRLRIILYAGPDGNGLDDQNNLTEEHSRKVNRVIPKFGNKEEIPKLMNLIKQSYDMS